MPKTYHKKWQLHGKTRYKSEFMIYVINGDAYRTVKGKCEPTKPQACKYIQFKQIFDL